MIFSSNFDISQGVNTFDYNQHLNIIGKKVHLTSLVVWTFQFFFLNANDIFHLKSQIHIIFSAVM